MGFSSRLFFSCLVMFVLIFAFRRLGLRPWPAFGISWALLLSVAAIVQFT